MSLGVCQSVASVNAHFGKGAVEVRNFAILRPDQLDPFMVDQANLAVVSDNSDPVLIRAGKIVIAII